MTKARLFGTDGVRGKANESLTVALAMQLGAAVACWILRRRSSVPEEYHSHSKPSVVIGRDTRISCDMLESALCAGLNSMGVSVLSIGVVPTPAVSFAVHSGSADAGIVISASHNPYWDNGIKLFGADGRKLPDTVEDEIQAIIESLDTCEMPASEAIGIVTRSHRPVDDYIDHLLAMVGFSDEAPPPLAGMSVVLDCANGAASEIAPKVFELLGADIALLHSTPNGININVECGSTRPHSMAETVRAIGAHVGLAFDGDADRVIMADEHGAIVDGDRMMAIIGKHLQSKGRLKGNVVVATIMSNVGLEQALAVDGISLNRTDVGDRYVSEAMTALDASIGGEQSGHILLPEITRTGDGIVTGLQVLNVMRLQGKKLSDLAAVVKNCPQLLKSVRVNDRKSWKSDPEIQEAIREGELALGKANWLSVRPSGTEPLIRVMAQGTDEQVVQTVVLRLIGLVEAKYGIDRQ